jgi:ATP-dependent exoDNAse (exonuclease V) alpha subunit
METNFKLKPGQQAALDKFKTFIDSDNTRIFILKGYAGTGKTTLLRMLVKELTERECNFKLLASTGRAAKIVSNITGSETKTVHSLIYTFQKLNQDIATIVDDRKATGVDKSGQLLLNFELVSINDQSETVRFYIVDEASMVSDKADNNAVQAIFGTGRLLADLLKYDPRGKFIFVGDECQLPPVAQNFSPALSAGYISATFELKPTKQH